MQRYKNNNSFPIEAIYVFPVDEGAAISGFEARVGERLVKGVVKEKEEAKAEYDDALSSGHGAYMLESQSSDVLSVQLGNLGPEQEVELTVRYSALCDVELDSVTFKVPTTIKERYTPSVPYPKPTSGQGPTYESSVSYGLTFRMDMFMNGKILSVSSSTHPLKVRSDPDDPHRSTVELGVVESSMDHDLVLSVEHTGVHEPAICLASEPEPGVSSAAVMLSFVPKFDSDADPSPDTELIFLVDRSGSMEFGAGSGKSPMEQCKDALELFLKSLPENCLFNIVSFGSSYQKMFTTSMRYNATTMQHAVTEVAKMSSNLGGTEILRPLKDLLEAPTVVKGAPRQIFLLTDGSVGNTNEIIREVKRYSQSTRVFTFGVGDGAGQELVRGVARAGNGESCFIRAGEAMDEKVITQLEKVLGPVLDCPTLDWGSLRVKQQSPSSAAMAPVFDGSHYTVFALLEPGSQRQGEVTLSGKVGGEAKSYKLQVSPWTADSTSSQILHSMVARRLIRDLEESVSGADAHKKEIVSLSLTWQVVSSQTSFIAVEEREESVQGSMHTVRVPLASISSKSGLSPFDILCGGTATSFPQVQLMSALAAPPAGLSNRYGGSPFSSSAGSFGSHGSIPFPVYGAVPQQQASMMPAQAIQAQMQAPFMPAAQAAPPPFMPSRGLGPGAAFGAMAGGGPIMQSFPAGAMAGRAMSDPFGAPIAGGAMTDPSLGKPIGGGAPSGVSAMGSLGKPIGGGATSGVSAMGSPFGAHIGQSLNSPAVSAFSQAGGGMDNALDMDCLFAEGQASSTALPTDHVQAIARLQESDGSWHMTASLTTAVGLSDEVVRAAKPADTGSDELWATAVALAFLEVRCADRRAAFRLLVKKAKRWMAKQQGLSDQRAEKLLTAAKNLF